MLNRLLFLFFCICQLPVFGQIADQFSDGNFTTNPTWSGDVGVFQVNASGELQLNAIGAGTSALFTSGNIPDSAIWNFDVRLTFDPSASNLVRIYLQADQSDVSVANGYFLEMGETGSNDEIKLFRLDGGAKTEIAAGVAGLAANSPNLHIRVTRTSAGLWSVNAATVGSTLQPQFSVTDHAWPGGAGLFFGFQCVYTASNSTKFYFDNIDIKADIPDTQAPVLQSVNIVSAQQVQVVFNEILDSLSAITASNYSISSGIGQPNSVVLQTDRQTVNLLLSNPLQTGNYTLQTANIKDLAGNTAGSQSLNFAYVLVEVPMPGDLLITEIMSDPAPSAGLPEVEWLEIFNRSDRYLELSTVALSEGTSDPKVLPAYIMKPGEWVVLASPVNAATLNVVVTGTVLGVSGFSSTGLNNTDDVVTLSDASTGEVLESVSYSYVWHSDLVKKEGGWSLERRNTDPDCSAASNWQSCPVTPGGTPGAINAAMQQTLDVPAAQDLIFNEIMFNAPTGGSEYVELFNRSDKPIALSDLTIRGESASYRLFSENVLNPGEYLTLAETPADLVSRFRNVETDALLESDLPTLADDAGWIALDWARSCQTKTLDSLHYIDDWHSPLLSVSDRDGVALERICAKAPTNSPANWMSASALPNGAAGSPTQENTQQSDCTEASTGLITLGRKRLSPDNDGREDFLDIAYALPRDGYFATMIIFDSEGIPVKNLVRQALIGTSGILRWDGDADDGSRLRPGIYVLYMEVFHPEGDTERVKEAISVVTNF